MKYIKDIVSEEAELREEKKRRRKLEREYKNKILDTALTIGYVEHMEQLTEEINRWGILNVIDKPLILRGFLVALNEVERDVTLKGDNLLNTLLNVKQSLFLRNKFTAAYKDLSHVSLAVAHMINRNGVRR